MDPDYRIEFKDLRDEFRMIRDGVISNVMNRDFVNVGWGPAGIMCDGSGADLFTTSSSDQQATSSSNESPSSSETQQMVLRDEQTRSHDPIKNPLLLKEPREKEWVDSPPAEATQRSRKGHKKSS